MGALEEGRRIQRKCAVQADLSLVWMENLSFLISLLSCPLPHSYYYPDNLNTQENDLPNMLTSHFLISLMPTIFASFQTQEPQLGPFHYLDHSVFERLPQNSHLKNISLFFLLFFLPHICLTKIIILQSFLFFLSAKVYF